MGQVILITSGKGGTGKTVITANLGTLLAKYGKKVLLIDLDMGSRDLDLSLGLEDQIVYNVMDVVSGLCRIRQALIKDKRYDNLYLMSATPRRDNRDITPLHMEVLCEKLRDTFDFILIDCPAGIGELIDVAAGGADKALIVTEATVAAARDADILNHRLRELGVTDTNCILNRLRVDLMEKGLAPELDTIKEIVSSSIIGAIQYDDNILISSNKGLPIVIKEGTYIESNFKDIVTRLLA